MSKLKKQFDKSLKVEGAWLTRDEFKALLDSDDPKAIAFQLYDWIQKLYYKTEE
jgi:hypothetical protein